MTRDEVIDRIKVLKARCERLALNINRGFSEWKMDAEACEIAISALTPPTQAQMERVWPGCDNCTAGDGEFRGYCDKWGPDDYCGLCGRPLTPKAWEELRKRLEALKDGKGD